MRRGYGPNLGKAAGKLSLAQRLGIRVVANFACMTH